ncbi:MAG: tetraacyldisaccharide 4'-kinase [Bacteroidales bacterium]|nr:tetraacyldisaccharide 4'-kinase [Bacteroidales bacterium]
MLFCLSVGIKINIFLILLPVNYLRLLLFPFSILYGLIVRVRNLLFDWKLLKQQQFDVPIIAVGNLSVGGTGKTPHIEYLIRILKDSCSIASLSRGYGRKTKGFLLANDEHDFKDIGDEPSQFHHKFKDLTVAVDENRCRGISQLLELENKPDVILLDDAFQHRYVKPGLTILLTDFHKIYTEDYLLPTGTLREPVSGARRADVIIVTKTPRIFSPLLKRYLEEKLQVTDHQKLYFSYIKYGDLLPFSKAALPIQSFNFKSILLFSGIANTYPLENYCKKHCEDLLNINFADHYQYKISDIESIKRQYEELRGTNKVIITTEKDAMRLFEPEIKLLLDDIPVYYLPIEVALHDNAEEEFEQTILNYVGKVTRNS